MYAAEGVSVAVIAQTMEGLATCTSVLITTVQVDVAELGRFIFMFVRGAGNV